jgi:hypothetical protein
VDEPNCGEFNGASRSLVSIGIKIKRDEHLLILNADIKTRCYKNKLKVWVLAERPVLVTFVICLFVKVDFLFVFRIAIHIKFSNSIYIFKEE